MAVYKCPVCDGKGTVQKSFYEIPGETVSFSGYKEMQNKRTMCMACFGRGVIVDSIMTPPAFCTGLNDEVGYKKQADTPYDFCPNCGSKM